MSDCQSVAFVGLGAFERRTLESFFRLDAGRLRYACTDAIDAADWLISDADRPEAVLRVERLDRMRETVFVGAGTVPLCSGAQLPRPIDAHQLRRQLDLLGERRAARAARPGALLQLPPGPHRERIAALADQQIHDFRASSGFSNTVLAEGEQRLDRILVVSSSPAECRLLRDTLAPLGYRVHLTRSAGEAQQMTERLGYGFVFLGVGQGGSAGFQVSRRIRREMADGGPAPVVVALAPRGAAIERIRATFAGCDAFLTTPLDERELLHLLARHDRTFERVFQPTELMVPLEMRA